jgi:hypothetical protein
VASTLRATQQLLQAWRKVGIEPGFPQPGPFPVADSFGVSVAVGMVIKSLEPGKYAGYQQFKSIRKLRAGTRHSLCILSELRRGAFVEWDKWCNKIGKSHYL